MYPELRAKFDKKIVENLFFALVGGLASNVLTCYAVLFDCSIVGIVSAFFQAVLVVFIFYLFSRWMYMVAAKQNTPFIHFDRLNTDEYVTMSYLVPLFLSSFVQLIYAFSSGEVSWQKRSQTGLLVHMATIYALHMTLIRKCYM